MLLGQRLPGPALQPDALTHGLCADLVEALEVALQSLDVIAHEQGRPGTRVRMLGLVAAMLVGHAQAELREPAALDAAGKRLAKTSKDHATKVSRLWKHNRDACRQMRSRHKGSEAELQARLAQAARDTAESVAAARGRSAAHVFESSGKAVRPQIDAAQALVEGPRVTASMQDAAASLTAFAAPAPAAPEAPELLREKTAACEAASAAIQAKYTAEHMRSAAYGDVQAARQQLRDSIAELEARHSRALEERDAAHAAALAAALEQREAAHAAALFVERRR